MGSANANANAHSSISSNLPPAQGIQMQDLGSRSRRAFYEENLNDPNLDFMRQSFHSVSAPSHNLLTASSIDTESNRFESERSNELTAGDDWCEESPYPEVRASVSSVDDPDMPVNTFRMWFLGIFFVFVATMFNQVLNFRYPSVLLSGIVIQLISLPFGRLLARILPRTIFDTFGYKWTLNPGPFSVKEHVCITIMGNLACDGVYSMETVICRRVFYGMQVPYSHQILLALGTEVFGFSLAGLLRQFVIWPAQMIWPNVLASCALYNTLHQAYQPEAKAQLSRRRFFFFVAVGAFVWHWVPVYLFTALSMFNWVCWIFPENTTINALFGVRTGLGMSILTFDWSMIAFIGSPLINPWWSQGNIAVSFVIFVWIIIPVAYFTNTFYSAHFPVTTFQLFDNTGQRYQVKNILTNGIFDHDKYLAYSPPYLSISSAMSYGFAFATFSSIVVHTFLWFRKDIIRQFKRTLKDEQDIHSHLMRNYTEVSWWWYLGTGVISAVFIFISMVIVPSQLPLWALALALFFAAAFALPLAILVAISNQNISLNIMSQLIVGYILPGRPIAAILFKTITFTTGYQSITFLMDLKTGHYMKVPPRVMFMVQLTGAIIGTFLVFGVEEWLFNTIEDMCSPKQKNGFICPGSHTFFASSVIWGGVGPAKLFSPGRLYSPLLWFFLVGAVLPIPFYFLAKRFPLGIWRYVNIPIVFAALRTIQFASGMNLGSWILTGFIFNYLVRQYRFNWWLNYNYVLSAALDTGVAFVLLALFFFLQLPRGGMSLDWWGNSIWANTADGMGIPLKPVLEGTKIGPSSW